MDQILKIRRPDTLHPFKAMPKTPNRIPWTTYYIVPYVTAPEISKLFKTAWVIFPTASVITTLTVEWNKIPSKHSYEARRALMGKTACIVVPTYVTSQQRYAFQYSTQSIKCKSSYFNGGFGQMYYLENNEFTEACSYCPRSVYHLVGECSPGTEKCRTDHRSEL